MSVVTVDGYAGTGKGTAAAAFAHRIGYIVLDTGAMYRAIAYAYLCANGPIDIIAIDIVHHCLTEQTISLARVGQDIHVLLDANDISAYIRTPQVNTVVSQISKIPAVREQMILLQQEIGQGTNIVADGRDMGSIVFPHAKTKFLFTCDAHIRAERRQKQLGSQGIFQSVEEIEENILLRDSLDQHHIDILIRKFGETVVTIDTGMLTPSQVVDVMMEAYGRD